MKRVRVTYEALVEEELIKDESEILAEGDFDDFEDAIIIDGLFGVIDGSFDYTVDWEISDVSEQEGE